MQCLERSIRSARFRAALAGAVALVAALPALAQDAGSHPVDSALETMGLKTESGPMPDFVTQSRDSQAARDYIPVGAKPPGRSLKAKTPAEIKALTAELDAARAAQVAGKRPKRAGATAAKPSHGKAPPAAQEASTNR